MVALKGSGRPTTSVNPFSSVMPILDDLLDLIGKKTTAEEIGGDSNEDIVVVVGHSDILRRRTLAGPVNETI